MRTSSPLQVSIRRFAVWRGLVATFAGLASVSIAAWAVLGPEPLALRIALGALCLVATAYAARWLLLIPAHPVDLRWDGARWLVAAADAPARDAVPTRLEVAIDAGGWMLLRLQPEQPTMRGDTRWLPVERGALGVDWHLLRSTIYTARPADEGADAGVLAP
ncbi:hypothetical protein [Piscinibacter koreensis]|uniref:Toxin CptA n=1 Tax=Piscinibacter koreensis TaxID=2742824 RepID=A0A7Y6NPI2_9BURK|nr:hypothetical protein [Schlegelella koreensis]NUZ06970.1 hypothetical protein [Schlegelella koreensis]